MKLPSLFRLCAPTLLVLTLLAAPDRVRTQGTPAAPPAAAVAPGTNGTAGALSLEDQERATDKQHLRLINQAIQAYRQKHGDLPNWLSDLVPEFLADTNVLMSPVELRTGRSVLWGYDDPKVKSSYIYEFSQTKAGGRRDQDIPLTMKQWKMLQMEEFGPVVPLLRCHLHDPVLNLSYSGDIYETSLFWESDTKTIALMARLGPGPGAREGKKLRVTVVDALSGEPLPAAEVNASNRQSEFGPLPPRRVTTDAKGQCEVNLGGARPKGIRLQAGKPGHATAQIQWDESGIPDQWTARLPKGVTVAGLVKDSQGNPVAQASVSINTVTHDEVGQSLEVETDAPTTDSAGRWSSGSVPADFKSLTFKLTHPDFRAAEYYISDSGSGGSQEGSKADLLAGKAVMVMEPGTTLAGTVTDSNAKPLANADVFLRDASDPPKDRFATTDSSGQFKLVFTDAGQGVLAVAAKGFSPQSINITFDSGLKQVGFKLQPAKPLKGVVLGQDRKPVAGATVDLVSWNDLPFPRWQTQTDAKVGFTWDSTPGEGAVLSARLDGYVPEQQNLAPGDEDVTLVLKPAAQIFGKVVDAQTKEPIQAFQVIMGRVFSGEDVMNWERYNPLRASGGKYSYRNEQNLFGGRIRLLVEAKGYLPQVSPPLSPSVWLTNDFELRRGDGPKGALKLPNGQPAAGVKVALLTGDYLQLKDGRIESRGTGDSVVTSDADGKFALPAAYATRLVAAGSEGYAEALLERLDTTLTLILQPWGRIEGVVRNGPKPATNEWVMVAQAQGGFGMGLQYDFDCYRAQADDQGRFVFTNVPPGERFLTRLYPMEGNRGWMWSHGETITVKAGEATRIDYGGKGRTVIGRVVPNESRDIPWQSGQHMLGTSQPRPPSGSFKSREEAEAWQNTPAVKEARARYRYYSVQFGGDGSFRVEDVPPGKYELNLTFNEPGQQSFSTGAYIGSIHREVEVAEIANGRADEPVDLGRLDLVVQSQR